MVSLGTAADGFTPSAGVRNVEPPCGPPVIITPGGPSVPTAGPGPGIPQPCPKPNPEPDPNPLPDPVLSEVFDLPFEVIHAHLLSNGKVLFWAHHGTTFIWDPVSRQFETPAQPNYDTYCTGHSFLSDGKLLVAGGHVHGGEPLSHASIYDPLADTWRRVQPMNDGRCHATNTTLANGDILTISGDASDGLGQNTIPQVWEHASETWRNLSAADRELPDSPFTYLAPNGRVFQAGPNPDTAYLDTAATGAWTPVANTQSGIERDHGSSVTFAPGRVMIVGGGEMPTPTAELISLYSPAPVWQIIPPMEFPRRHLYATALPDDTVLVTGGTSAPGFNDPSGAVLTPELWDPRTDIWTNLPDLQFPRLYHSIALLLPDGRVLLAGGDVNDGAGSQWNAEIYSPPYMFASDRPRITAVPGVIDYGQSFSIGMRDAERIQDVKLIRLGSVTHGFNQNQGVASVGFSVEPGRLRVAPLNDPFVTPPGDYLLFIVNDEREPSEARIIRLRDETPPRVVSAVLLTGRRKSSSQIALTFSEPLEPNRAGDVQNFSVRLPGRDRLFKTGDDLILKLQSVRYDRSARAVILTLPKPLPKRLTLMVTAVGRPAAGLVDLMGFYLDGNSDGTPGDDFEAVLGSGRRRR